MKKRLKAWVILSLSAVLCAFLGLIGCSKQPEGETVDYTPVYGAYYCELDEGEEYRLVLSQGGYVWVAAGKTETGTYRYDGEKLYFAFADTQTETSASVENNVLSVTYKGSAYRLYKEVGYTVSYVADGETTNANVINGKSAAKPSDPQKDGNLFVGWYSDEAYTKPYDFATPVTSDVTLYACFTEGDANDAEYTVTFISEGATLQTKQTIGGKAFDLPVPTGDKTFIGWWVSDYQSASKLTYKYGGEVLTADTDFYAVWAEDGKTSVSVNAEGVTWASVGVNASYSVKITAPDGSAAAPVTVGSTTYAYDFASKAAGDYVVEVTVNGNTATAYYKNKALARVSSFKVVEPSVLLFSPVENAQKYYITVDCGEEGHNHIRVDNGSSVYFNFANCAMQPGGIEFTVEAAAAGYASSVAHYTVNRELQAATNLKIDAATDEVSWNAVENAAEYIVKITTANGTEIVNVGAATKYSLKNYDAGTVSVEVTAQTKGYNSSEAASVSYTKTAIATPSNIKVKNNVVTWDAVSGATAYKIKVGTVEKTVTANAEDTTVSFTLTNDRYGTYAVSVKAVAATDSASSAYSEALLVSYGDSVSAASYANGTVTWKPVANAAGYAVKVNGVAAVTVNDGAYSAAVTLTKSGVNVIDVYYIAESGAEIKWASVEAYAYSVIFDARGGSAVETQYKAVGDPVTLPVAKGTGYDFAGWYTLPGGAANNGALYSDKAFGETNDVVLYAAWTPKDYTVQLDFGGEEAGENATTAQVTYKRGYTVTMPVTSSDATKAFAGWYSQPNAQGTRYTDEKGNSLAVWDYNEDDRTFYAAWVSVFTFNEIENGNAYSVSKGKSIDLVSEVTVPTEYNGKPVTTVEGSAFQLCRKLVTVNIPDTVKLIETGTAFLNCSLLKDVNIYETESNDKGAYTSVDGILIYDNVNNGVELKYFPQGRSGEVVIPDGVETLPVAIFKSSSITKVTIPASVTTINSNAFYYSRKLTQVVFEAPADGAIGNALSIEENAFRYCTALTAIDLPARLAAFDSNIFTQCTALAIVNVEGTGGTYTSKNGVLCNEDGTQIVFCPVGRTGAYTIPAGVNSIGASAFKGCTKLTSLVVPGYVTEISKDAFSGCTGLTSLVFEGDKFNEKLTVGESAFYGCTKLTKVTLPENLSVLAKNAFGNTQKLAEVTVNCGAEITFENAAFGTTDKTPVYYVEKLNIGADCGVFDINGAFGTELSYVSVAEANPNYSVVDDVIFDKAITRIVYYPSSQTGDYVIPATVTEIGANVFYGKKLSKITIGKNIVSIGDYAFANSKNLATVEFEDGGTENLVIGANVFSGTPITQMALPARVSEFGASAFADCKDLATVSIPAVQTVPTAAFKGCAALVTVNLPEGVQTISSEAFAGCTALTSIAIPASVTVLGTDTDGALNVFTNSTAISAINVAPENAKYASVNGVLYAKNESGVNSTLFYCPVGNTGNDGVFTVPADVTRVESGAFAKNKGITKVEFSGAGSNFTFGNKVFDGCTGLKEVRLPSGLTEVGESLFANCTSLTKVFIPNTVSLIGNMAFYKCTMLREVEFEAGNISNPLVIADGSEVGGPPQYYGVFVGCRSLGEISFPERTTVIGSYAFSIVDIRQGPYREEVVNGITTVNIPSTVTEIKNKAFYYAQVETVNIAPNSQLTKIGQEAFYSSYSTSPTAPSTAKLTSFTLPASVETIDAMAFYGCGALTNFTIESGSQLKTIGIGAFYSCVNLPSFTVPATVETIGEDAFYNAAKMSSFTFAEGTVINEIGDGAFEKCVALTSFTFPETETEISVGSQIFKSCTALKTVTFSKSVTSVSSALLGCDAIETLTIAPENLNVVLLDKALMSKDGKELYYILSSAKGEYIIPDGVESISSYVFSGKKNISSVSIPASVREIGSYAFSNCSGLTSVTFAENSELKEIGAYAFEQCSKLTSIDIPDKVTELGGSTFSKCSALTNVTLPDDLTKVGTYLFRDCVGLTAINIPAQLTTLGNYMFYGCTKLTSVTFSGGVTAFGTYVFSKCNSLKEIVIPDTVTSLGGNSIKNGYVSVSGYVFKDCALLEKVTLPEGLTAIPGATFQNCPKLKTLEIPKSVKAIGVSAFEGCKAINNLVIPEGVLLGNGTAPTSNCNVFYNCANLSDIVFEGSLNYVGKWCFAGCTALKSLTLKGVTGFGQEAFSKSGLTSFEIPDTAKTIYNSAFASCTSLEKVVIPASVTSLGIGVFSGCEKLTNIVIDAANVSYKSENGWIYTIEDMLVYCPGFVEGEVVLDEGVTLYSNAFENCKKITRVVLPNSVTEIPTNAFKGCTALESIIIPAGVKSIGNYAFNGCTSLTSVDLPGELKTIGTYAFDGCTNMASVTLGEELQTIGNYAFRKCAITSVVIPDTVTNIGSSVFYGCTQLESVQLSKSLKVIGASAFYNCTALTSITLPGSITSLGGSLFSGCTKLASVTIENGITSIPATIFQNCTSLTEIVLPESVISVNANAFKGCTITVHVPYASEEDLLPGLKTLLTTTTATITVVYDKAVNE